MQGQALDKTCLVIFGMHRSGTSLLAKLCSLAGGVLPEAVIDASDSNEAGHWEPRRLAEYNDEVLGELGRSWDDFRDIEMSDHQRRDYVEQLKYLIRDDYKDAAHIVLKEPRSSRFVGPALQALTELGYRVCPVHAVRHPIEVAQSLERRDGIADRFSGLYWLRYVLDVERDLADSDHRIVSYAEALKNPESTIRDLYAHFDLELSNASFSEAAKAFAQPELKHHSAVSWSGAPAYYRDWIRPVYEVLKSAAPKAPVGEDRAALERVAKSLSDASPALHELRIGNHSADERSRIFQNDLKLALDRVKALEDDLADTLKASHAAEDRDRESIQALQNDLRDSQATLKALQDEFRNREVFLMEKLEGSIASHRDDLATLNSKIAELEGDLKYLSGEKKKLEKKSQRLTGDYQTLQSDFAELEKAQTKALDIIETTVAPMIGLSLDDVRSLSPEVRLDRASEYAERARAEFDAVAKNNEARGERLHLVETQLAYAKARSDHFENLTGELYASTSWKMTAPLRRIFDLWQNKSRVAFKLMAGQRLRDFMRDPELGSALDASRSPSIRQARNGLMKRRPEVLKEETFLLPTSIKAAEDLPSLTVSAVTFNSSRWLDGFFKSLLKLDYPLEKVTLHMVDNGSTDDTCKKIRAFETKHWEQFAQIRLSERPNLGYGVGNDWAIRRSEDEFVLVTNVDVSFYPESLKRCVEFALNDQPDVACWEFRQTPYEHPKYYDPVTLETNWNAHACVLFRRQAYLDVGGYDPKIFMYGEDVELSYRFRSRGYRLRYVPSAVIEHFVDLEDNTLRPHQLSGSTAANILLRYRYGTRGDMAAGEALLNAVKRNETDPNRRQAFEKVSEIVGRERWHFWRRRPSRRALKRAGASFPFNEFDYGITRQGADVIRRPFDAQKKDLPLVSIVTRTHGENLQHVRNAIASVLNQTYPNIEHIIVEDRTDVAKEFVEEVAKRVGEHRLRYLKSPGQGRSECGNYGAENTRGEWLCWLDNDDLLFADHVETLVRALDEQPDAVASYALAWDAHSTMVDGEPHLTRFELPPAHLKPFDPQRLLVENFIPIQAIIFKKSMFDQFGGFNPDFDHLEDWNLWVRYSQVGPFVFTPKVTSIYLTPDDPADRERRHLQLHAAYESVRDRNLEDVAVIQKKLDKDRASRTAKAKTPSRQRMSSEAG